MATDMKRLAELRDIRTAKQADGDWYGYAEDADGYIVRFFGPSSKSGIERQLRGPSFAKILDEGGTLNTTGPGDRRFETHKKTDSWFKKLPAKDKNDLDKMLEGSTKQASTTKEAKLMSRQEAILKKYMAEAGSKAVAEFDSLPAKVRSALSAVKDQETLASDVDRWLWDNNNPHKKQAGCEKLPEGGMRDNCEAKKNEGEKSDKKAAKFSPKGQYRILHNFKEVGRETTLAKAKEFCKDHGTGYGGSARWKDEIASYGQGRKKSWYGGPGQAYTIELDEGKGSDKEARLAELRAGRTAGKLGPSDGTQAWKLADMLSKTWRTVEYNPRTRTGSANAGGLVFTFRESSNDPAVICEITSHPYMKARAEDILKALDHINKAFNLV